MINSNPFTPCFIEFFERIGSLKGMLLFIESSVESNLYHIQKYVVDEKLNEESIPFFVHSNVCINDIRIGRNGFYSPEEGKFRITLSKLEIETENLKNREAAYTVSQSFETFETFIKEVIAISLKLNPESKDLLSWKKGTTLTDNWRENINYINSGKYNNGFFQYFRKLMPNFKSYELNNKAQFNYNLWYKIFTFARHIITHSNGIFLEQEKEKIKFSIEEEKYFGLLPYCSDSDKHTFKLSCEIANSNLMIVSDYAFLIYNEISTFYKYESTNFN